MTPNPQNTTALSVVPLAGLHLDTLGHYFAALGLLRLAARKWPSVKGCWRDGVFHLIGGPKDFSKLEVFLFDVGANEKWTRYEYGWESANKKASDIITKSTSKTPEQKAEASREAAQLLSLWQNSVDETVIPLFMSHIVAAGRRRINPLFRNPGGKRNYPVGWSSARDAVKAVSPKSKKSKSKPSENTLSVSGVTMMPENARKDLAAFLGGGICSLLGAYNAGSWFSDANKKYNFSPDSPFRNGQITPWAMLLACEAFPLLVGATSRQLGSVREGVGAFPYVTNGSAPENEGEVGISVGEFWAPVWNKPFSIAEVSALYKRGRAEVNGCGAITSAAFAAAIIQRGTDAGLLEFRRFALFPTTNPKTFESRLASVHALGVTQEGDTAQAAAVSSIIRFRDALPREFKKGKSWVYRGLQGPIDTALVRLSASGNNEDMLRENSWALLDAVFASLKKTANNKTYREREPVLELLPVSWIVSLLQKECEITPEIRIALALATLQAGAQKKGSNSDDARKRDLPAPFFAYRVGVIPVWKNKWNRVKIAKITPLRIEWSERPLTENLIAVIRRRVTIEAEAQGQPSLITQLTLPLADVFAFLNNEIDEAALTRWLDRFLLFDWSFLQTVERDALSTLLRPAKYSSAGGLHASEAVLCFLRPLFHANTFTQIQPGPKPGKAPTTGMLRPIVALLERGDTAAAFSATKNRYNSLLVETADFEENEFVLSDPRRMLATLLLPASPTAIAKHFSRFQLTKSSNKKQKS